MVFAPHGIVINGGEEPFFVSVYSSNGSLVSQLSHQTGQIELDFDSLTPGVYVLAMHNTFFTKHTNLSDKIF
ncbi:MAG: T9SS type A sorting domain-containing protein [Saprospiraceae bacterium]|nr:T9SS type A sorting domain-containing protein [Saprospiraceae bacterium]